ncbi:MAG: ABC transporter ATP-binding protein, partial [Sulfurovum sp.]
MSNVITASHLTLAYNNGKTEIIKDATFSIKQGEFVFITGPSGSGKSTLLKALYGQLKPSEGDLVVGGLDLTNVRQSRLQEL